MPFTFHKAELEDIYWVANQERHYYVGLDVIPEATLVSWFEANSNGFFVIRDEKSINIGCLNVLPLKPEPLSNLIDGNLREYSVSDSHLYQPSEYESIKSLWVENLMVLVEDEPLSVRQAAIMTLLSNLNWAVSKICDHSKLQHIFCIVATYRGERLVKSLGFELIRTGISRQGDGHDLYRVEWMVLQDRINRILSRGSR
jgi:hypothetical protein